MKFIHTSDIHLASKLTTRLPSSKVASRRRELTQGFIRMCSEGMTLGVSTIVIAGDLFDSEKISHREIDQLLAVIERAELVDIAPTLAAILGETLPDACGKALKELLK